MTGWLFVLCCVVGLAVFLSWQRKSVAPQRKPVNDQAVSPYHGVLIMPEKNCCSGAMNLGERRYLAREAPRLPLPNCDAANCHCRYSHFDDRRDGERRRSNAVQRGLRSSQSNTENRSKRDRRMSKPMGFPSNAI